MSIKNTFRVGYFITAVLFVVLGIITLLSYSQISIKTEGIHVDKVKTMFIVNSMYEELLESTPLIYEYTVTGNAQVKADFAEKITSYDKFEADFKQAAKIGQVGEDPKEKKIFIALHNAKINYQKTTENLFGVFEKNHKLVAKDFENIKTKMNKAHTYMDELFTLRKQKIEIASEEITSSIKTITTTIIVIALIIGIIAGSIAIYMWHSISKPLEALGISVKAIADGDFNQRAKILNKNEIGSLANNFNIMVDKLWQSTVHLEKTVAERTKELEEEKIRLQASISSLPVGFLMTDTKENIVTMNGIAKSILCLKSENNSAGVVTKENLEHLDCDLNEIGERLKGNLNIKSAISKVIKDQQPFEIKDLALDNLFLHIFISPIVAVKEKKFLVIGSVILVENITEQKILDRSRDEFFSIASHELRTPLTAIKGNTSMMLEYFADQLKNPQLKEMVDDVHESSIRLINIVNDFLDTSRLELNKMEFKKENFDLVRLIPDVIKQYQVTGSRKKLYIHFENTGKIPVVVGDQDRFRQVLINLIGNGLKFTEKGGITINLKQENNFVKTLVIDTGMGISEENQKLLFRKFQQAEGNIMTRDAVQGTGLGLYISKMMVEGMGGKINLENSVVGKGTTFSFTLPIAKKI